jgi:hypothetical protein
MISTVNSNATGANADASHGPIADRACATFAATLAATPNTNASHGTTRAPRWADHTGPPRLTAR